MADVRGTRGMQRLLRRWGVRARIVGCTKINPGIVQQQRGDEIAQWLNQHRRGRFVILDDDADMRHFRYRLVQSRFKIGLTHALAKKAESILTR